MAPSPWRDEVGLLEKHSRAKRSLFFGADEGGGVKQQGWQLFGHVTIVLA